MHSHSQFAGSKGLKLSRQSAEPNNNPSWGLQGPWVTQIGTQAKGATSRTLLDGKISLQSCRRFRLSLLFSSLSPERFSPDVIYQRLNAGLLTYEYVALQRSNDPTTQRYLNGLCRYRRVPFSFHFLFALHARGWMLHIYPLSGAHKTKVGTAPASLLGSLVRLPQSKEPC